MATEYGVYLMLRTDNESNLQSKLQDKEMGFVDGSPIAEVNDDGTFRRFLFSSEQAIINDLILDGTYDAGTGGTPASPEAITNANRSVITVAPSTTGTNDSYSLDTQATDGKLLLVINEGTVPAFLTMPDSRIIRLQADDALVLVSYSSSWHPIPNRAEKDLTIDQSTAFGGASENTWRFYRQDGRVDVLLNSESNSVDTGQGGNAYIEFDLDSDYDDYQPSTLVIAPIILEINGTEQAGYVYFDASSRAVRIYLLGSTFSDSDTVIWAQQMVSYPLVESAF